MENLVELKNDIEKVKKDFLIVVKYKDNSFVFEPLTELKLYVELENVLNKISILKDKVYIREIGDIFGMIQLILKKFYLSVSAFKNYYEELAKILSKVYEKEVLPAEVDSLLLSMDSEKLSKYIDIIENDINLKEKLNKYVIDTIKSVSFVDLSQFINISILILVVSLRKYNNLDFRKNILVKIREKYREEFFFELFLDLFDLALLRDLVFLVLMKSKEYMEKLKENVKVLSDFESIKKELESVYEGLKEEVRENVKEIMYKKQGGVSNE